ncbi:MAG: DUF2752 domain-containing protein [Pricia sp.]
MQVLTIFLAIEDYMLPCLTKKLLDFDCPGCGLQRSVMLLIQGDFVEAFQMYPALYAIVLLLGFLLFDNFLQIRHSNKIIIGLMVSSVALILGNYILKFI